MNSETRFNMSQKEMENSKFQKTGNSFTESYDSLKRKILDLEQRILDVAGIFNEENSKIQVVGDNKDELQELLKQKNKEISTKLSDEINKVKDEMDNHFTNQKNENAKLQKEIANLKDQKRQLQDLLTGLLKKIADLEMQVGMPEHLLVNNTL
jgi:SMC interacting uncharacterized protein involved in chromosome segregation